MAKTFLTSIDLAQNELQNAVLHSLSTAPATPKDGQIYYNSGTKRPMYWNNTAWSLFGHTDAEIKALAIASPLTGLPAATNAAIAVSDTMLSAFSKLQGQITAIPRGTVTSVGMTVPTGLTVTGSPITTSGTLAISLTSGYSIPTTAKQTQWDTAYTNGVTAIAVTGTTTKTITLTRAAGNLTANFTDNDTTYSAAAGGGLKLTSTAFAIDVAYANTWTAQQTFSGGIKIGNAVLKYDATNNALYVEGLTVGSTMNFYATGEVSAYGAGAGGGSGSSYLRLDAWADYDATKSGYVLSALLGVDLNTRISNLEGGSATTISVTGAGNAITSVSKTGSTLSFLKEKTFAELDAGGKVLASQLPSYVDDVIEEANLAAFPTTGETGKIYIAQDTNKTYRWSGTAYTEISASLALGTTSSTAFRGDYGNTAYNHAISAHQAILNGTGFVKVSGTTVSYDNSTYSLSSHNHSGIYEPVFTKNTAFNKNFGTTAGTVTQGNDARLSDARTPTKAVGTIAAALTTAVTHGLGNDNVIAQVMTSAGEVVECDITTASGVTTFSFNVAPAAGAYKYVIIG